MTENEIKEMKFIGYLGNTDYAIKERNGTSDNGRAWEMTSVSLSINFSTFRRNVAEQVKRLTSKQQVTIIGIPKITQKGDKTYMNVEIVSVEGDMSLAADGDREPLKQPPDGTQPLTQPIDDDPFL